MISGLKIKLHRARVNPDRVRLKLRKMLALRLRSCRWSRGWSPPPTIVSVVPTFACNLRCITCGLHHNLTRRERQPEGTDFNREMTEEDLLCLADALGTLRPTVQLSGGEPTLHPSLIPFLRRLSLTHRLNTDILTNGLRLGDLAGDLLASEPAMLHVSLDGTDAAYDAVRGAGKFIQFDRSVRRFFEVKRRWRHGRPRMTAVFTVTTDNQHAIADTAQYAMERGFDQFLILHPVRITEANVRQNNETLKNPRDHALWTWGENLAIEAVDIPALKKMIEATRSLVHKYPGRRFSTNPDLSIYGYERYYSQTPVSPSLRQTCPAFYLHCVIYPDGSVMPSNGCYFQSMGNVFDTPLKTIWNDPAYRALRRRARTNGYIPLCTYCFIAYNGCI